MINYIAFEGFKVDLSTTILGGTGKLHIKIKYTTEDVAAGVDIKFYIYNLNMKSFFQNSESQVLSYAIIAGN